MRTKCLNLSFQVRKPVSRSDWDTGPSEPEQTETSATVRLPGRQDDRKALGSFYKPTEESRVNWVPQLVLDRNLQRAQRRSEVSKQSRA